MLRNYFIFHCLLYTFSATLWIRVHMFTVSIEVVPTPPPTSMTEHLPASLPYNHLNKRRAPIFIYYIAYISPFSWKDISRAHRSFKDKWIITNHKITRQFLSVILRIPEHLTQKWDDKVYLVWPEHLRHRTNNMTARIREMFYKSRTFLCGKSEISLPSVQTNQ